MANYYEPTTILSNSFVNFSSRYADSDVVYYTENKLITFPIYKKAPSVTSRQDKFAVITAGTEYRPDLVSQQAYGTPDFWWKIMEINGIKDIIDFKTGRTIRIPNSVLL